jgi:hypothetical protein
MPKAPKAKDLPPGYVEVDWETLAAYDYKPHLADLPEAIRALDGKRVVLRGFLMPLLEWDDIHEFCVVQTHASCCFGVPAGLSGMVYAKIDSERGLPNTNEPIEVSGTFRVGEKSEEGYVLAIFSIEKATGRVVGY